jgi:flagellin
MGINIRTNVPSLEAQRYLNESTTRLRSAYARLSSGLRITTVSDDAAGLAIAEQLRADSRIASVAIRNASDGVSIIAITDGAMNEITNVLMRMGELAEQSANGVFSTTQRSALALEFNDLASEIERIAKTTEFNDLQLLSGGSEVVFQVGFDGRSTSQVSYSGVQATLAALGLAPNGSSNLIYSINASTNVGAQEGSRNALDAVKVAINSITTARGSLGAAESRIRDVDVASEAAELTRLNILQQAASSVLAQANQQPTLALSLLQ